VHRRWLLSGCALVLSVSTQPYPKRRNPAKEAPRSHGHVRDQQSERHLSGRIDPAKPALIVAHTPDTETVTSYGTLQTRANAVARALTRDSCARSERIAILAANVEDYLATYLGIMQKACLWFALARRSRPGSPRPVRARHHGSARSRHVHLPQRFHRQAEGRAAYSSRPYLGDGGADEKYTGHAGTVGCRRRPRSTT